MLNNNKIKFLRIKNNNLKNNKDKLCHLKIKSLLSKDNWNMYMIVEVYKANKMS